MSGFERALDDIRAGRPVLVYDFDDRERETDMTVASQFVTASTLRTMRHDAGGLVCTTTPGRLAAVSPSSFTEPGRVWNSFWRSFRRSMAGPARCW